MHSPASVYFCLLVEGLLRTTINSSLLLAEPNDCQVFLGNGKPLTALPRKDFLLPGGCLIRTTIVNKGKVVVLSSVSPVGKAVITEENHRAKPACLSLRCGGLPSFCSVGTPCPLSFPDYLSVKPILILLSILKVVIHSAHNT